MWPTLDNGDTVLVDLRAYKSSKPEIGDLIYSRHPYKRNVHLVKRVFEVSENGSLELRGDNPDILSTTDSRSFGKVPPALVFGRVIARLSAPS